MIRDRNGCIWYKGNLHTHTTLSDGRLTPEESAALYRARGYDFLAFTDHWKPSENRVDESGLLLLSGAEYDFGRNVREGVYHVVAIGCERDPQITRAESSVEGAQAAIDKIHEAGGLADLAHPAWSMNSLDQLLPLCGVDFTEIFNSVSDLPRNCRPYSGGEIDRLAARGVFWKTAAVDDTHWYGELDAARSFIYVKAGECTREAVLAALRRGDFYSSQGPRLDAVFDREAGAVRVKCEAEDDIRSVVYFTDAVWTNHRADVGERLTESVFRLTGRETFVRVEIRDAAGRYAWSQTISVG